jgi:hypothetical protein
MRDIWASSPTDVHVVGHNDQNRGLMYHYDGKSWSDVKLAVSQGGQIIGALDFSAIYGFGPNDVYAVGERIYTNPNPPPNFLDSSLIIHFDGVQWREITIARGRYLSSVWGANSQDVWAGGNNGALYHFKNGFWGKIDFDSLSFIASINGISESNVFFIVVKEDIFLPNDSLNYQLWNYNGNILSIIDSFLITPTNLQRKFGWWLWQSEGILYSSGFGVFKREGTTWQKMLDYNSSLRINGTSSKNIFAVGDYGKIFHWNGSNWLELSQMANTAIQLLSVWTGNNETFIVGHDGMKTYVLRGR